MTESEALEDFEMFCKGKILCVTGEALEMIRTSIKEREQYRAIGTVEELRLAKEKQIPKKPEYEADGYVDGELVYDYAKCPICGHDFEYGINDWGCKYCSDCGQKLDWSDEE